MESVFVIRPFFDMERVTRGRVGRESLGEAQAGRGSCTLPFASCTQIALLGRISSAVTVDKHWFGRRINWYDKQPVVLKDCIFNRFEWFEILIASLVEQNVLSKM